MTTTTKPPGFDGEFSHEVGDFQGKIYRQLTDHTCGPAAIRMLLLHYGIDVPEGDIAEQCFTLPSGTLHWGADNALDYFLRPIELHSNFTAPTNYKRIKQSIAENHPVLFIYATENDFEQGEKCLHYSLVIGIDEKHEFISIANPFGRIEKLTFDDWWERFTLMERYMPSLEKFAVDIGILKERTSFIVQKRTWYSVLYKNAVALLNTSNPALQRTASGGR